MYMYTPSSLFIGLMLIIVMITQSKQINPDDPGKSTAHLLGDEPCVPFEYWATSLISFRLCLGKSEEEVRAGRTVTAMIRSRGFQPMCRGFHLLMWMMETVVPLSSNGYFLDTNPYIGGCVFHMAALGYKVIAAEKYEGFVDTMMGTMAMNPAFHHEVEIHHAALGTAHENKRVKFWHAGSGNNVNTGYDDAEADDPDGVNLEVVPFPSLVQERQVTLAALACVTSCNMGDILKTIPQIKLQTLPMIYLEVHFRYTKTTTEIHDILHILHHNDYIILPFIYPEYEYYYGRRSQEPEEVDKLFGSKVFGIPYSEDLIVETAKKFLNTKIDHDTLSEAFNREFHGVVAMTRSLYEKMVQHFLPDAEPSNYNRHLFGENFTLSSV
mmetsp:Transcript_1740/g.2721  ORF Transcript_1740/g.2721 Transcript_1740/m.2721 type:complete len:382 (+) Transcript_1740:54-1199(+)